MLKKILLSTILLSSAVNFYAKDADMSKRSYVESVEDQYDQPSEPIVLSDTDKEKIRLLQAELFDAIQKQSHAIQASLEQIIHVLHANKIKFDESKISKKEIEQQIVAISNIIHDIYAQYENVPVSDRIHIYTILNKGFMDYLIPCMHQPTLFNKENFAIFAQDMFEPTSTWNKNLEEQSMQDLFASNEQNIVKIMHAADNFGLTTFNKLFRSFQDDTLSLTGQPLMATCQTAAFYGSIIALTASIALYATDKDFVDNLFNKTLPESVRTYVKYVQDFIGHNSYTTNAMQALNQNNAQAITQARASFGILNHADEYTRLFTNGPLITPVATFLAVNWNPLYKYMQEQSGVAYKKTIAYLRGEVDKINHSKFESNAAKVYFKDMIGCQHLEKLAYELVDFLKHPQRYENSGTTPETGILLTGPSQTGKSFFAHALKTLIDEETGNHGQEVKFLYVTSDMIWEYGLDAIFAHARQHAPYILFFDEVDMTGARRDKNSKATNDMLTNMSGLNNDSSKKVIVIAATNRPEELDFALLKDGRFGTQIRFELPTYEHRKLYLQKIIKKRNITSLSEQDIDEIAQETEGSIYNTLEKVVTKAIAHAIRESRPVNRADFEQSLDYHLRQIRTNVMMNEAEKEIVAIYHAGQAAARHILSTVQQVVKITIHAVDKPVKGKEGFSLETKSQANNGENIDHIHHERIRSIKLGHVFTLHTSNNTELLSDQDQENEILALLAGQAALELIKHKTYQNFGKEDRAKILHLLEAKISQGGPINDDIRKQALAEKEILTAKIKEILELHIPLINTISAELLQHNSIDKYQWKSLIANYTI